MGGIARTVNYNGNRIDIGGHRFFSKSDRVMEWWLDMLPLEDAAGGDSRRSPTRTQAAHACKATALAPTPNATDEVMLVRDRASRIYFLRQFFDYPITLERGHARQARPVAQLPDRASATCKATAFPHPQRRRTSRSSSSTASAASSTAPSSRTTPRRCGACRCTEISAEWGAQRDQGPVDHARRVHCTRSKSLLQASVEAAVDAEGRRDLAHRAVPLSEVRPGPDVGEVAREGARERGGEISHALERRSRSKRAAKRITGVRARNLDTGEQRAARRRLLLLDDADEGAGARPRQPTSPRESRDVAEGLVYRDFITVGLLARQAEARRARRTARSSCRDNWIYIQEPDVKVGRLQIFNNWSPYMVADPNKVWIGLEYFCNEGDELWTQSDAELDRARQTRARQDRASSTARTCATPSCCGCRRPTPRTSAPTTASTTLRDWLDGFENLFLVGRNGMHRYNNQDHSMLTAMTAVDNIRDGSAPTSRTSGREHRRGLPRGEMTGRSGEGLESGAGRRRVEGALVEERDRGSSSCSARLSSSFTSRSSASCRAGPRSSSPSRRSSRSRSRRCAASASSSSLARDLPRAALAPALLLLAVAVLRFFPGRLRRLVSSGE